jgi:hypothetical protein
MRLAGLPSGLEVTGGCAPSPAGETCTWGVSGVADVPVGTYEAVVLDGTFEVDAFTITVRPEAATATFPGMNPAVVEVTEPGSNASEPFRITVRFAEAQPDQASGTALPGLLERLEPAVELSPVIGGGGLTAIDCETVRIVGDGYDAKLTYRCSFDAVPVGIYTVTAAAGGGFFVGEGEDVVAVVDPSLGSATGFGTFGWPGTGDPTDVAFTLEYNRSGKSLGGALTLIRHAADGDHVLRSNSLDGLSLGSSGDAGWATFSGKATYEDPGTDEPHGNHEFVAHVEDGPSGDRFWIEIQDQADAVTVEASMTRPANDHAVELTSGEIVIAGNTNILHADTRNRR